MDIDRTLSWVFRVAIIGLLCVGIGMLNSLTYKVNQIENQIYWNPVEKSVDTVRIEVPVRSNRKTMRKMVSEGMIGLFKLYTPVDTMISDQLRTAITEYCGPSVKVNSMRRHGTKSDHCKGRAIDLEFCDVLIEYLVSADGQKWLQDHNLIFYIEGRPGSRKVANYNKGIYKEFVFFNPRATGDHIHIEIS